MLQYDDDAERWKKVAIYANTVDGSGFRRQMDGRMHLWKEHGEWMAEEMYEYLFGEKP